MLSLPEQDIAQIKSFYSKILEKVKNEVRQSSLKAKAKAYLTDEKITQVITSKPKELIRFHNELVNAIGGTVKDYNTFLKVKRKKEKTEEELRLFRMFNGTMKKLGNIFNYDDYISLKKTTSYELSKLIGRNTCTYCNRIYTLTVIGRDSETDWVNNRTRIIRPQFDHWFSKKRYPLLALSFYNLIPSCQICNSSIKGEANYSLKTHVHPYVFDSQESFRFSYEPTSEGKNIVILKCGGSKIEKTLKDLKVKEIYDGHSEFELQDLLDLRYKYSDNYLQLLFNETFELPEVDKKDAYRMLFGVEIDPSMFHARPFSKFKYDILKGLKIIR